MKLKVCGMKYKENIQELMQIEPDYMGMIFYDKSPRNIDEPINMELHSVKKVGVFVNHSLREISELIDQYGLYAVQLHGQESHDYCSLLRKVVKADLKIIKVFSIRDEFDFSRLQPYEDVVDYYLFDTKGELPGGNGFAFDWSVLKDYPSTKPFFLSGGIGPQSIDDIKEFLKTEAGQYCHAIDVNSGFEIEPGLKNIDALKRFKEKL